MSDAAAVTVVTVGALVLAFLVIVVIQVRVRRQIAQAGTDAIRVRLRANRHGYAAGLVPIAEELLQRVETLEREVAALKVQAPK